MAIRFPKIHIAQSTSNRILNVAGGLPEPARAPIVPPMLPDVGRQGLVLDTQLATPPVPTELPAGADGAVVGAALAGDDLSMASLAPLGIEA